MFGKGNDVSKEEALRAAYQKATSRVEAERLPGWQEHMDQDPSVGDWMAKQLAKVERAIRDEDDILFDRALGGWLKGWDKVNTAIAEKYRLENTDASTWQLRYVKWMKLKYMKFECDMGTFFIVPRKPSRKPRAQHWFTVDEMLDILNSPATVAAIKTFESLPVRPGSMEKPKAGEKHLVMDFTKEEPDIYYNFKGSVRRG
jgi:hypothetical protein